MKKALSYLAWIIVIIIALVSFHSCAKESRKQVREFKQAQIEAFENTFGTNRPLRKMINSKEEESNGSFAGGYFLFLGAMSGSFKTSTNLYVYFSWQQKNTNIYPNIKIPLSRVRVETVTENIEPTVTFILDKSYLHNKTPSSIKRDLQRTINYNSYIPHVIITCSEKDWPSDITLPLNEQPTNS